MGCEGYSALARVYDRLNADLDYEAWADFLEACFKQYLKKSPELVLDLACGTGTMTRVLSSRGYDIIGVDGSADMLSEAYSLGNGEGKILYLCQDMREFELYGTVGAVVSCLDSINYLLTEDDLRATFAGVHNYLDPDGIFLFDVNSSYKFSEIYGNNAYVLEDETPDGGAVFCGWQNEYDRESGICDFWLSIFEEDEDGRYCRSDEHQRERCYSLETLRRLLEQAGFEWLGAFGDFRFSAPTEKTERWYIAARAKK